MASPRFSTTDQPSPPDLQALDSGLSAFNEHEPQLAGVRRLCVLAHGADGGLVGGALGRTWGECCELLQLWVDQAWRGQGLGRRLMQDFESAASARGCRLVYLDTFSFQAPGFYTRLGYVPALVTRGFAPGIVKTTFHKVIGGAEDRG